MSTVKNVTTMIISALLFTAYSSQQVFAWTVNANFDSGTLGTKASSTSAFSEAFTNTLFSKEKQHDGLQSAKMSVDQGTYGFGEWGGRISAVTPLRQGQEVWLRAYIYFPTDFDYSAGGVGLKTLRIHTQSDTGSNQGYMDMLIGSSGLLVAGNEVTGNVDKNLGSVVRKGVWEAFEMYVRFDSRPGYGVQRLWQNGKLVYENKTNKTLGSSTSTADFMYIFSYWNDAAPRTQSAYVDSIIFTSDKPAKTDTNGNPMIGLSGIALAPPKSPPSITIQ